MGIFVKYLSELPREYTLYGVFIANRYGTVAEKIVAENFEKISRDIGSKNIVAKVLTWEGAAQAEAKFGIAITDMRPILVVTQAHPEDWTPTEPMIKIQLGKMKNADDVRNFLMLLSQWFASEDLGRIDWELRVQRLKTAAKNLSAIIQLQKSLSNSQ